MKILIFICIIVLFLLYEYYDNIKIHINNLLSGYYYKNVISKINKNIHIGNVLSDYYYKYVISILKKKDFIYSNKKNFIKNFPNHIKWDENIFKKFIEHNINLNDIKNINPEGFWSVQNYKIQQIHNIMKPTIHKIFDNVFKNLKLNKEIKYPIIHFRCADTPFIKHSLYYFQRYEYFDKSLKDIENKIGKITDITILACSDHLSNENNKKTCNTYSNKLKEYLKDYNIHLKCNSDVDDFVSMFYAPAVISTISSYSFMSGFFGSGIYIQPNTMRNNIEVCLNCNNDYKGYNITHDKVKDYHNVDEVYTLLIE
jgi:hypothetical protein